MGKVSYIKLYGIGHVLSSTVFHETLKCSIEQSFKDGYMIKLDKTLKFHGTKFHRVAWALDSLLQFLVIAYLLSLHK